MEDYENKVSWSDGESSFQAGCSGGCLLTILVIIAVVITLTILRVHHVI